MFCHYISNGTVTLGPTDLGTQIETITVHMFLSKNPQFLPNRKENFSEWSTHMYLILTKFRHDWLKIVDFLSKAYVL